MTSTPHRRRAPLALAFVLAPAFLLAAAKLPAQGPPLAFTLDQHPLRTLADPASTRAVLLFFVASECPISNRTFPEMQRLRQLFASRGVRTWFVYPDSTERPAGVLAHQHAFDTGGDPLLDPDGTLTRLARARVTPEAAILIPAPSTPAGWRPVYTGRIDDRFLHLGVERPAPTQLFVQQALDALLAGRPVPAATGSPVGCSILTGSAQ